MRLPAALALVLLLPACSGNHDQLALRPSPSQDGGSPSQDHDAGDEDAADVDAGEEDVEIPQEPPGPFVLTVVNGMPDTPAIRLCFVPLVEGEERVANAVLWPAEGLGFGRAKVTASLGAIDWATTALRPYVLAGDALSGVTGCAEALEEEGEDLVATPLPVLPAAGFTEGRSVLLVTTGCALGPVGMCHDAPFAEGGAGLVAVPMARKPFGPGIGVQVVHAFASTTSVAIDIAPSMDLAPFTVTNSVTPGGIAPHPYAFAHEVSRFGPIPRDATVVVRTVNSTAELARFSFGSALAHGGIEPTAFVEGKNYVLVAVGPAPNLDRPAGWEPFTFVVVEGDPSAQ